MDDLLGLEYPVRGIKDEKGEWQFGSLSLDEVDNLRTDFLFRAFSLFNEWQTFGVLPHGKGTLDEPPAYLQAMSILKDEDNGWQMWEMENRKATAKSGR